GRYEIDTGIGFFDHMLASFTRHSSCDMILTAKGDLNVDTHHTVEDTGIVLGEAIKKALGDKNGITRFGSCILPMDETLVLAAIDLSGRPYLVYEADFPRETIGDLETETIKEFFYALSYSAGMNIHIKVLSKGNAHHMAEAMFKAFARALKAAAAIEPGAEGVPSTKGILE
ncbi:MAG: imidazoleglycerol-phosphate dehydratase HisB, partial [Lachnospiraceae bacterium]|nr:imidazoleglycerol-phosphate dehydratase HisB [Lachnospiraceae bacterium]